MDGNDAQAEIKRTTKETDISVKLAIDGAGRAKYRPASAFSIICSINWRAIR